MKTLILISIIGLSFTCFQLNAQQVVFSSDFENWTAGNYPDGWGSAGTNIPVDSLQIYTANPHSGTKACKFINRDLSADTIYAIQTIDLIKGHQYRFSAWVKGRGYVIIKILYGPLTMLSSSNNSDTWQEKSLTFNVTDSCLNTRLMIKVFRTYPTYDDIQVDDIKVEDFGLFQATVDINNISAMINANGALFWDMNGAFFEAPKGSGHMSLFASAIHVGGLDQNDSAHLAVTRYFQTGADIQVGPVANDYTSANYISRYHKLWKVNKLDIDYHISHYNTSGYVMPESIATWPGNGDVSNGEAHILAPFADLNENGIYEPTQGEYPYIRGDQAVFAIVNDDLVHSESFGRKFGLEEHLMLYSFNHPSDSAINNTVFLTYDIINRSDTNYHDVYTGMWSDIDIGYADDDYIGCDSILNFIYGYNADNNDSDNTPFSYGHNPPAQGLVLLNYGMSSVNYYFNNYIDSTVYHYTNSLYESISFPYYYTNPIDGSHTKFPFNGYPENQTGWYEDTLLGNTPGDVRGVANTGPFSFPSGSSICMEYAFPFARDYNGTNLSSIALLRQRVQAVKTFYDNQNFDCMNTPYSVPPLSADAGNISVYPNPSNGIYTFHQTEYKGSLQVKVYNTLGQCVFSQKSQNNDWQVNINSESNGIYFYTVSNNDGKVLKNGKLIKNSD